MRWVFVALAISRADPLHILSAHHSLENVVVGRAEFNELKQVHYVVLGHSDVAELFILVRDQVLLVLNLDAHARDVVVVADVVLTLRASSGVPLHEPRMVQGRAGLEHAKQIKLLWYFHAGCGVHVDLLDLIARERWWVFYAVHIHD